MKGECAEETVKRSERDHPQKAEWERAVLPPPPAPSTQQGPAGAASQPTQTSMERWLKRPSEYTEYTLHAEMGCFIAWGQWPSVFSALFSAT